MCTVQFFALNLQAEADGYTELCTDPIYAECRTTDVASVTWYQYKEFSPIDLKYDYICNANGLYCSEINADGASQYCPDLKVRYVCPVQGTS